MSKAVQVAVVTGAASGMGLAISKALVEKGWKVQLADVNEDALKSLAVELGAENVIYHKTDVTDYKNQAEAFRAAFDKWGRIDYAIANAGIIKGDFYTPVPFDSQGLPSKPDVLAVDVDLYGVVYTAHLAIQFFHKTAEKTGSEATGLIGMTSSVSGIYPSGHQPLYAAAKAGVLNFMRSMALQFKQTDSKIRTFCVCPALVQTNLVPASWFTKMPDLITPTSVIVDAYMKFIDDPEMSGQALECSKGGYNLHTQPDYTNEYTRRLLTSKRSID